MIPKLSELPTFDVQNKKEIKMEYLYEQVLNNITNISHTYENMLDPQYNSTTKQYMNEGYDQTTAYALSFTTTLMLYLQISNINII